MRYTTELDRLLTERYDAQLRVELAEFWCERKLAAEARDDLRRIDAAIDDELAGRQAVSA